MAEDLQIRIPVTLGMENIPEEVKKIQQQLSNNKNTNIKINAILSDDSINNIKNQLQSLFNNKQAINLNVNSNVQSQLSQVNQTVTTQINAINKKAVVAPKVDISQIDLENLKAMSNAFIKAFDIKSLTSETKTELQSLMREFQVTTQKQDFSAIAKAQQALQQFAQDYGKQFKNQETITAFNNFKALYHDIANAVGECDVATRQYLGTNKQFKQIFGDTWNNLRNKDVVGVPDDSALWKLGSTLDDILINYRQQILNFLSEINKSFTTISQLDQLDINKLFSSIANISGSSGLINTAQQIQNIISGFTNLDGKLQITQDLFNQFTANGTNTSSLNSTLEKIGLSYTVVDNNAQNAIGTMAQFSSVYNEVANVQKAYAENIKQSIDVENQNTTATKNSTELAQKKLRAIEEVTKAQEKQNKVLKSASNFRDYIDSSLMTFSGNENGINEAIQAFKKFGEVSSSSIKYPTMNTRGGSSDLIKYFTIEVKSATGELQKFAYTWKNIGDEDNPNFVYMLSNVREADAGIQKLIASQQKYNDKIKALQTSFTSDLQKIRSSWEDVNGGKSVKSDENINNLNQQYIKVEQSIEALKNADEVTMASMKANVVTQIDKLNQMVTQYHNAEKVATQLRAKGFETVKIDTGNNIDKFINSINNSKVPVQAMKTEIDNLTSSFSNLNNIEDQAGKSSALTSILNILDNAKTKFQALQELFKGSGNSNWLTINSDQINKIDDMATKTAIYKNYLSNIANEWKGQQLLVGNVAKEMASLQRGITSIKNPAVLDKYVARIQELATNYQRLKINLDSQVESQNKIYQIQTQISKLSSTDVSNKTYLEQKLHDEEKTLQNLQMQSGTLKNIVSLEEQEAYVTQQVKKAREDATIAQNHQTDAQMAKNIKQVSDYATAIEKSIVNLNRLKNSKIFADNSNKSSVQAQIAQLDQFITKLTQMRETVGTMVTVGNTTGKVDTTAFATLVNDMTNLNNQIKTVETSAKDLQTQLKQTNGVDVQKGKIKVLVAQLEAFAMANGKAMKSNKTLTSGMTVSQEWNAMMSKLKSGADNGDIQKITSQFKAMRSEVKALGLEGGTVFQNLWAAVKKFSSWMGITASVSRVTMKIRQAVTEIKELDNILTEISKTSDRTIQSLEKLGNSAFDTASKYGRTASDYLTGVQEMSRAGFNEQGSEQMAELSILAQSAGDMDTELANAYLIATNAAYKLNGSAEKLNDVLDRQNYVTNRNAVNLTELANATKIAGSQASTSSVGVDEMTAAVGTMIATTQEGGEVAGRAFKAIIMNLQQVSADADEIGDGGEAITSESLTKYEKACEALGVSLKEVRDGAIKLRDPMQVLEELANSVSKEADGSIKIANLINAVGGKYRGNQLISLLNNWDAYKKMLSEYNSNEAVGSALEEANKSAENLTGRLNALSNSFAKLVNSFADSSTMKTFVNGLNDIINIINTLIDGFGTLQTLIPAVFVALKMKNMGGIFKVIDGQFTSIFARSKQVTQSLKITTQQINNTVNAFNSLNAKQSFGSNWDRFITAVGNRNQNVANYFQDIAQQGASVRASVEGVFAAMMNGNTKGMANVRSIISAFNNINPQNQQAFAGAVSQTNAQLGIYLGNLNGAKASMKSYGAVLVANTAKTVALQVASAALNAVISMGLSLAISAVIKVFEVWINHTQEAIDKANEASKVVEEQENSIDSYIDKIIELRQELDNTNLSQDENRSLQEDLLKIQKELIDKYGDQAKGIDLVTGSIESQSEALYNLNKLSYNDQYGLNKEGYDAARKQIEHATAKIDFKRVTANDLGSSSLPDVKELRDYIKQQFEEKGFTKKGKDSYDERSYMELSSNMYTIDNALKEIYSNIETYSKNGSEQVKKAADVSLTYISQVRRDWSNKTLEENEELFGQWVKYGDKYGDKYLSIVRKKNNLEYALESDNAEDIAKAREEYTTEYEKIVQEAIKNGDTDVARYLEKLFSKTVNGIKDVETSTNNATTEVASLNDALTKLQELLKDIISGSSTYQSAMQKVSAGTGLTAKEVNELLELDPSLFDKFVKQKDGTWTIDLEALRLSYDTIIVDGGKNAIAEEKKSYQEQFNAVSKEIENLYVQRAEKLKHINGKADLDELNALDKQIEERKKALQGAQDDLNVASFQETLLDYSDADRIRDSFDEVTKQVDSYNDSISTLKKAQETLNEGNSLSYDDMTKLIMLYPQLKNSVIETADGYTFEQSALEDVSKQAYQTRDDYIDSQIDMTKSAIEQAKLRMEEYAHEIALISSAYAYKHAVETGLFKDYASVKDSITAMEELVNILTGYKNEVKEPSSSSSKSADKSISDALQNQIDYYTTLLDAIEAVTDKQIDALEKEKDAIDSKIDALNDEKDALKDKNDEQQRELDLIEAQNNLDKAKKQKVFVYKEGEGLVQVQDEKTVKDAQKELDDVEREIKEADIDKQIEVYEKQQEVIDKQINSANAYKDTFSDMESNAKDQLAIEQAKKALGVDENGLLHIDENTVKNIRNGLAEAIYNKDVNDNKDNDKYVTVSLADYLSGLGATVTPQQFQAIANTATGNTPITAPVTNSTVNNAQSIVNNKSITLNNTFNIYDSKDSNTVIEQIKSYMNKTLRTAINSIK